jgi:ferredoxin
MAMVNPDVRLAHLLHNVDRYETDQLPDEIEAFNAGNQTHEMVFEKAQQKTKQFALGSILLGGWMGLIAGVSLINQSVFWKRSGYEAHRSGCIACGRCYSSCPIHRKWLKKKQTNIQEPA